jgi:hypothetical protein
MKEQTECKCSQEKLEEILTSFEGHIYNNLNKTSYLEREDLAQEIRLKIIEKFYSSHLQKIPSFWEVLSNKAFS